MEYKHLIGRTFKHGSQDCFGLARDFYNENFDLGIPNYARPYEWWYKGLDLYMESFYDHGFRVVTEHPSQWRLGDAVLMAIRSKVACHCGIFVEPNRILHHFIGRLSTVDDYRGLWRNSTLAVLRHKDVVAPKPNVVQLDFMELLPNALRRKLTSVVPQSRSPVA
jgi:cell wall-associated NlpC family hydrolase